MLFVQVDFLLLPVLASGIVAVILNSIIPNEEEGPIQDIVEGREGFGHGNINRDRDVESDDHEGEKSL